MAPYCLTESLYIAVRVTNCTMKELFQCFHFLLPMDPAHGQTVQGLAPLPWLPSRPSAHSLAFLVHFLSSTPQVLTRTHFCEPLRAPFSVDPFPISSSTANFVFLQRRRHHCFCARWCLPLSLVEIWGVGNSLPRLTASGLFLYTGYPPCLFTSL